ncbi:MAG: hypothetical protein AB7I33_15405 [Gemmatimonadales bacterium]
MMDPVEAWHGLLTDQLAADSHGMLEEQLRRRGLVFGSRPLCTVLRPRFMTPAAWRRLQQRVRLLLGAFRRAYDAALQDRALRAQFRLADWEEELLQVDPGFAGASPTSRLDLFQHGDGMALTEYNAETPAAAANNDALAEAFQDLPIMRAFARRWEVQPMLARHGVLHVLLDAWEQWSGGRTPPRIAIVDWPDVPTRSEFVLYRDFFAGLGLECVIVEPAELEYGGGRLSAAGGTVDLVYKRVLLTELVQRGGLDQPLIRAVRDRAVCMVNGFRCKLLHKKASLAVLSDERSARLFRPEELEAIRAFVPWTRVVEERRTVFHDEPVDLTAFMTANRERLVLKPNDDYGGAGIVLGWEVDGSAWEQAMRVALDAPYIVQERVAIPAEPFPSLIEGRVQVLPRMLDTAPFVSHEDYAVGCLTRLSTAALLNVTAGGGSTVPAFLVEER